jgi:hypothetical protein
MAPIGCAPGVIGSARNASSPQEPVISVDVMSQVYQRETTTASAC